MSATPDGARPAPVLLPATVIGSYSVPEWLGQLKNDFYRHRISRRYLDEIHEMAIKAAVVDQTRAGIDIISDGELRRDNDVDYLLARVPGVEIPRRDKADSSVALRARMAVWPGCRHEPETEGAQATSQNRLLV